MKTRRYFPEIYNSALNWLIAEVVVLAMFGILFSTQTSVVWFGVAGFGLCFAVVVARTRSEQIAAYAMIGGLWVFNSVALANFPALSVSAYFYGPLIVATANLLSWRVTLALGGASFVVLVALQTPGLPIFVLILTCAACLLFAHGLRRALTIALDHQEYAVQQMELARTHRGEIAQLAKALQDSQESLQMINAQLRYARNSAEEAKRLKAQFAANVSHELRTPINLIIGFAEVIATSPESYPVALPAPFRADVLAIYRNARHLQGLINDILDISQVESAHLSIVREPTAPEQLVQEVTSMMLEMVQHKGLRLDVEVAPNLPTIEVDRTRIRQVLINLLANAIRFTDSGWIKLRAAVADHHLCLSVEDSGLGIPSDQLHQVFEEFYQVDGENYRREGGTGLGLTLSKKFVEQHGGVLQVESLGIAGQGSTFTLRLPLLVHTHPSVSGDVATDPSANANRQPILLWDDDPAVVHLFEGYLRMYPIQSANSIDALIALLQQNFVPLVVVPNDHPEAVARIRAARPDVTLMECPMPSGRRTVQRRGIADYLIKPVSRRTLLDALEPFGDTVNRILIVDDERDLARMFTRYLSASVHEYSIETATSGKEGIAKMNAQPPDLVILDILMPGLDGFGVIDHMKADVRLRAVPIIVVSAYGASEAIVATTYGDFIVHKPAGFMPLELVKCVEAVASALKPESQAESPLTKP